jgi:outer membrane protein
MSKKLIRCGRATPAYMAGAMVLLLLAGCGNWSDDVVRYRQVLDGTEPATRPAYDGAEALPLVLALQLANADNEAIATQGENYVQALAEKMRQAGTFLPTLSLGPTYSLSGTDGGTAHRLTVPVSASATGSLANIANLEAAGQNAQQRAQVLLNERETILLQVVQAYYTVIKAERQAEVYENSLKLKAERLRDQEARLKLENAKPLDVAQSQADLAGTRVALTQARTDAANARSALARLMGTATVGGPLTDAYVLPTEIPALEQWQQQAEAGRQDLQAATLTVEATRSGLDAAIRQYYPSVTINFDYYLHSDPASIQNWTGGVSAHLPIFSALAIEADIRRAWSVYRQAGLGVSQTRRQVVDDVNQGYQNLQNSRQKIADLQTQVDAAQRALTLAERSYQLGATSNLDRLTQQDAWLTAQLNLVSEELNAKTNHLVLLRTTGQLGRVIQSQP